MPTECICMSMILLVRSCLYDQPALAEDQAADHLISQLVARFLGSVTWALADHGNPSPSVRCGLPTNQDLPVRRGASWKSHRVRWSVAVEKLRCGKRSKITSRQDAYKRFVGND